jgi:UDP-2-acetamido-3-amino-2,3-dideoxy-glucuronate N-acetyltransferase
MSYFVHPTALVDAPANIGPGTKIWHFCHVMPGARIGPNCSFGQNVFIGGGVSIGANVKVQNNVSLYDGVELEDDVFCGPSCVFTNVTNPRSEIVRKSEYKVTRVLRGATIGANATIVCGSTVGRYAFIGAGAVVSKGEVPDYALMLGVPARRKGWVSRHGHVLGSPDAEGVMRCPETGWRYQETKGTLRCLDQPEHEPLPKAAKP